MKSTTIYPKIINHYEQWLANQFHLTEVTIANYGRWSRYFLNYLSAFNLPRLNDVDNDIVHQFIHFRKDKRTGVIKPYAQASIKSRLTALDLFFTWAYSEGHCRENPILRYKKSQLKNKPLIKREKVEAPIVVLTAKEQKKLKQLKTEGDYTQIRDKCIVLTILASALFAEELITLPIKDFHLNKGYLTLSRDHKPKRKVPLDLLLCEDACYAWLKIRKDLLGKAKQPLLFFNQSLQPLSKRMLYKIASEILAGAHIEKTHCGPDMLRQSAICNLLEKNTLEEVEKITGIKNLEHYRQATKNI